MSILEIKEKSGVDDSKIYRFFWFNFENFFKFFMIM